MPNKSYAFDLNYVYKNTSWENKWFELVNPKIAKTISCRGAIDQRADVTNFVVNDNSIEYTVDEMRNRILNGEQDTIRVFTPRECWALQGFDNEYFTRASTVCSNRNLYNQAGNSICVSVLEHILKNLLIDKTEKTQYTLF